MTKRYKVNPLSVLILPEVDEKNGFETIVLDVKKDTFLKIHPFGYWILRVSYGNPWLTVDGILRKLRVLFPDSKDYKKKKKVAEFVNFMKKRKVLIGK